MAGIPDKGFREPKELEAWLRSLPNKQAVQFARAIASRAALRAAPFTGRAFGAKTKDDEPARRMTIAVLRANAISRVALTYPSREIENAAFNAAAASDAAFNAYAASDAAAAYAASDAAFNAAAYAYAASDAAFNAAAASRAAAAFNAAYAFNAAAASRAAAAFNAAYAFNAAAAWAAVTADARALESGVSPAELADWPLWPGDAPDRWTDEVKSFTGRLNAPGDGSVGARSGSGGWAIWLDWYRPIVDGQPPFGLPRAIAGELEKRIALGDGRADFWDREPEAINTEIAGWVAAERSKLQSAKQPEPIPETLPASVRPRWQGERLVNPNAVDAKLGHEALTALFGSIKDELGEIGRDARSKKVTNSISKEARKAIADTAKLIPAGRVPDLQCLFRLAVKQAWFDDYRKTVNREWPDVIAGKYRAVAHQLDKALDQIDDLKQFKRNANNAEIEPALPSDVIEKIESLTKELRTGSARRFVAADIPSTLDRLASEATSPQETSSQDRTNYDLLEGANNLLKELVIKAEEGGPVHAGAEAYERAFAENYPEAAAKAGKDDAESAARWAGRAVLAKKAIGLGGHWLAEKYPRMFGWFGKHVPPPHDGVTVELQANESEGRQQMQKGPIAFEKAMHGIYTKAKLEAGYNASIYLQMLHRHGGLGTAKQLINSTTVSQGYTALSERGRLDLTVEALVIASPQWHDLFTADELARCRNRLREYGYVPK